MNSADRITTEGIEIIVDAKSDRKANYSINFVDSSDTATDKINILFENILPLEFSSTKIPSTKIILPLKLFFH